MHSPFPGMDPFIEGSGKGEDFHNKLIADIERYLSETLPARYVVRMGERSYIDALDPRSESGQNLLFKPEVGIKTATAVDRGSAEKVSLLEDAALDMEGQAEVDFREVYLEIHELDPEERLVTGIEILSPANKRPGSVGWYQYERKRRVFLEGHASLVEMDLVRGGRRHAMVQPWPDSPYVLMVMRKADAPRCKVWPAHYRQPLPPLPIPLAPPDADIPLDLQRLVDGVHARSRYGQSIDYARPLRPPLPADDVTWLQTRLRELRT